MRRPRLVLVVSCLTLTTAACGPVFHMQVPAPRGRYAVGRSSIVLVDSARIDPWRNDSSERRVIVVKVWYPADDPAAPASAYLPDASRLPGRFDFGERAVASHLGAHAYTDARVARDAPSFPVVIFSPGNDMSPDFYSGLLEELASHGYVVLGLDHAHEGKGQTLPDGRVLSVEVDRQRPAENAAAILAFYRKRAEMRAADAGFVLEKVNIAPSPVAGHLDLDHVGALGHSVGGVSAALMCRRDQRIRACVNLDGLVNAKPLLRDGDTFALDQPFMFLGKPLPFRNPAVNDSARRELEAAIASRTSETYDVVLDGFHHDTFSDYPFFTPTMRPTRNRANLEQVRDLTLAFFDKTLRGEPGTALARATAALGARDLRRTR